MTELRQQLDSARAAHRAAGYPGDLSADVLAIERAAACGRWALRPGLWALIGGMLAAASVAAVLVRAPVTPPAGLGPTTPGEVTVAPEPPLAPAVAQAPGHVPPSLPPRSARRALAGVVPAYPAIRLPALPSFPNRRSVMSVMYGADGPTTGPAVSESAPESGGDSGHLFILIVPLIAQELA